MNGQEMGGTTVFGCLMLIVLELFRITLIPVDEHASVFSNLMDVFEELGHHELIY